MSRPAAVRHVYKLYVLSSRRTSGAATRRLAQQPYDSSSIRTSRPAAIRLVQRLHVSPSSRTSRPAAVRLPKSRTPRATAVCFVQRPYVSSSSRTSRPASARLEQQSNVKSDSRSYRGPEVARYPQQPYVCRQPSRCPQNWRIWCYSSGAIVTRVPSAQAFPGVVLLAAWHE